MMGDRGRGGAGVEEKGDRGGCQEPKIDVCVEGGGSGLVPFWHGGQLWHSEEIRPLTGV